VVFVVLSYVEGDDVLYAIVAESFLFFVMGEVVLLDPTGAEWVLTYREEEACKQVYDGFGTEGIPHTGRKSDFRQPVERYPFVEGFDLFQAGDAEDLEDRVEEQPEHFTDEIVIDELCFPPIGQVSIQFMYALERVMFDMVAFEGHAAGEDLGQVGQDPGEAVGSPALEQEMVCAFVDHDEKRMVGKSAQ